jgi:microcystin-dependent protein
MATQAYIGEIRAVSFNYAPKGWQLCNGQLLAINQFQALFAILGTTYGGNGTTTFALPNLQGIVPLGVGPGFVQGQVGGSYSVSLASNQFSHTHLVAASATSNANVAAGNFPGASPPATGVYGTTPGATMNGAIVTAVGGSQPHNNQQPYLVVNYIICIAGIFPSRS